MHAYLIIGKGDDFIRGLPGRIIEFPFAKIADLRNLNNFTKLKLIEKTVIVLHDFDKSTDEAQNAFLKALEEPQESLIYVLTAQSFNNILPTIVSRCEVKEFGNLKFEISDQIRAELQNFLNSKTGDKLKFVSKINKREEGIEFLRNLIFVEHERMENFDVLDIALKTLNYLERNGNVTLQMMNFVISIS